MTRLTCAILFSALAATAARAESAGGAPVRPGRVTEGTLVWRTEHQEPVSAPVLETDVEMIVTGIVARARVRQTFTNPSREWAEGVYVFPLPDDAAVDHVRMQVGDRMIEGAPAPALRARPSSRPIATPTSASSSA